MSNKHAYLIMAHHELYILKSLIKTLDHVRHDFYIHIDKKSFIKKDDLLNVVKESNIYFTEQTDVHWGGYSQINAELILLESATKNDQYAYYHLLTGVDLPLKSPDYILRFFDECGDLEFISMNNWQEKDLERVLFRYPFQDKLKRGFWEKKIRRLGILWQRLIKYKRSKENIKYGIGSAYFDITDKLARYVCSKKEWIENTFKETFCADEVFLQTIFLNMENPNKRFISNYKDTFIEKTYQDVLRAIDWKRGDPYTYTLEDYDFLISSEYLFARKFSSSKDKKLIDSIVDSINANKL